ncbi:LysM domain-containing protein [Achromobacter mucicolens]|uniref:LysM domain-containing protein n=1 Tax=Achromobacter mucicolens TaxID=1389922 RepID=UPI001CC08A3D|nr:LysM domain-containing protein [Achromobacter mucicolens]UAN00459.1 LysM domain-containing protein [Achromobacter mucicolens]
MSVERFSANSRYHGVPTAEMPGPDGRPLVYLRRRFLPDPAALTAVGEVAVAPGDRLDRLAAAALGDPLQFWRLADGNDAPRPAALETPGRSLRVTLPALLGAPFNGQFGGGDA